MTDKKKPMGRKGGGKKLTSSSVLVQLYENSLLASKVDEALDTGQTLEYISDLCADQGLEISPSSLHRYNQKRQEAIESGQPLEDLLDLRRKSGNVIDIKSKKREDIVPAEVEPELSKAQIVFNDQQYLDEVIQKGMYALQYADTVEIPHVMKAIELKAKLSGNSMQGMTVMGLREMRLRVSARTSAITQALFQFVPQDQQEAALEAIEQAERDYYANLDLSEEERRITEALKQGGIDI